MAHTATSPSPAGATADATLLHRLDARAKIIGFIGLAAVVVSTPARAVWAFVLYAALLLFLIGLARLSLARLSRRLLVVAPLVLVVAVFLPFYDRAGPGGYSLGGLHVTGEGLLVLWNVSAKAVLATLSMIVLASTTGFTGLTEGFTRLRAPLVFVLVASFMYRYSFVFADEARRMRRAMTSRNYRSRWLGNVPALGHMLGALFVRSYGRGERVYVAMVSRGYEGTIPLHGETSFGRTETVFLVSLLVAAVGIRLAASLWMV